MNSKILPVKIIICRLQVQRPVYIYCLIQNDRDRVERFIENIQLDIKIRSKDRDIDR